MNVADSEVVHSVMLDAGFTRTQEEDLADVVLLNTCAIREGAEQRVWSRLDDFRVRKRRDHIIAKHQASVGLPTRPPLAVGVLGCMAERLKTQLLEKDMMVDMVVGPDAYRDLPRLLGVVDKGQPGVNTLLSVDETYADIAPVRTDSDGVSAYSSIMRGCENLCSYCIVPFTRGKERSRTADSIVDEVKKLRDLGYKEVTLLGQNVNSYNDISTGGRSLAKTKEAASRGFVNISRRPIERTGFTELLRRVAEVDNEIRIRFTSPHPKDFPDDLLHLIAERPNICKQIHVPAQSGSTTVLERMRRGYSRESYLKLIDLMKTTIPGVSISTDMISGFCGETDAEHADTVSLMKLVAYQQAFMFAYSQREKTFAHRHLADDVPNDIKMKRLREVIDAFHETSKPFADANLGKTELVLIDSVARRDDNDFTGRTDSNKRMFFPNVPVADGYNGINKVQLRVGDYVATRVDTSSSAGTMRGTPLYRSTLASFYSLMNNIPSMTSPVPTLRVSSLLNNGDDTNDIPSQTKQQAFA